MDHRTHLWSTEDDNRPSWFEDGLALASGLLDGSNDTQGPLERSSQILIDVSKIISYDPNLVAVTGEKGCDLLVVHAPVDGSLADLETVHVNDRQNSPRLLRVDVLGGMPSAVNCLLARSRFGIRSLLTRLWVLFQLRRHR